MIYFCDFLPLNIVLFSKVRAEEATLDASVPEANLTFQHLSRASQLPFKEKVDWFNKQCDVLRVPWDVEHQHLKVCFSGGRGEV